MPNAFASPYSKGPARQSIKRSKWLLSASGALALAATMHGYASADTSSAVYHGRDLGLPLKDAVAQVQATGASQAQHVSLSISGSGGQLMFTEVNFGTIEIETASVKDLDFTEVDVRKVGDAAGRYGITLRASEGSVNDHIVGASTGKAGTPDRDTALSYMDFWLVDPDMTRIRHVADLFATIRTRLQEQPAAHAPALVAEAAPPAAILATAVRNVVDEAPAAADDAAAMPTVLPAPRIPVSVEDADDAGPPAKSTSSGKCLFPSSKTSKHAKSKDVLQGWSTLKQAMAGGGGRLSYRIEAQHAAGTPQSIMFFLGNQLPVAGTVVARVILTSSSGSQQAEDIALGEVGGGTTKTDPTLQFTPFDDGTCITDVDVTEVHACPLPDTEASDPETDAKENIYRCNADAAAGTTTLNGITYVKGREPKMLTVAGK